MTSANDGAKTPKRRVTLADVAAHAGVSRALVSIVIRDVPGASAETRKRVMEAAEELGYRPDRRAQLLARQHSRLIGTVFGMAGTFHFDVLDGLYTAAEDRGYELILSALTPNRGERRAVESLQDFRFDALIMLGPDTTKTPLMVGKIPIVVVGWHVSHPAVDVVRTSDEEGMRLVIDHLTQRGHRRIVHVDGGEGAVSDARRTGYLAAMRSAGLGDHTRVLSGGLTQLEGSTAARTLLEESRLPSAVVAFNDEIAVAMLEAFVQAGYRVPQDISITGWDNSQIARLPHVRLTSVTQDAHEMARLAIDRAIARIEATPVADREQVLMPDLVVRATTGLAKADD